MNLSREQEREVHRLRGELDRLDRASLVGRYVAMGGRASTLLTDIALIDVIAFATVDPAHDTVTRRRVRKAA